MVTATPATTRQPPTMPANPLVGSAWDMQRRLLATQERAMRIGDVVRFSIGPPGARFVVYSVFEPDGVQRVLTGRSGYRKDNRFYREVRAALGDGLLTSQDETWIRQKRSLQPLFVRSQMLRYGAVVTEEAAALVEGWRTPAATGDPVSLHPDMTQLTVRIIGRILFGTDLTELIPLIGRAGPEVTADVYRRAFGPLPLPRSWPTRRNLRVRRVTRAVYGELDALVADRRRRGDTGRDMIGLLTRPDSGVSDEEVRDQLLVFLFAGHETTAGSLTFALHLLGSHPDVQRRAADEVEQVLAGRAPTADDVDRLPYVVQVLKEALRLYPPAYATSRRTVDGDVVCGYEIPAGADVAVYTWCTHRHPRHWDEPGRFDPDRFTPDREAARHRYAWFPFGGGPRACIGAQLSMMEATIALATILQAYRLSTPDGPIPLVPRITLNPAAPVLCRLESRLD